MNSKRELEKFNSITNKKLKIPNFSRPMNSTLSEETIQNVVLCENKLREIKPKVMENFKTKNNLDKNSITALTK